MKNAENKCLNCDDLLNDQLYCPNCGQKAVIHNLSIKYLLSSFYLAFYEFDKKLLRSLKDIWIPNKVSHSFLEGSRNIYVNHIRFFVICLAVFFGLIALNMKQLDLNNLDIIRESAVIKVYNDFIDFEKDTALSCDSTDLRALKTHLFKELDPDLDTLITIGSGFIDININANEGGIHINDIYNLSQDSLIKKYEIEGDFNQFLAKQLAKVFKSGSSSISFMVGNMFWGIVLTTILMAIFLKLVYIRHRSFYAEHLMQMINYHCIFSLLMSLLLFIDLFMDMNRFVYLAGTLISGLHLLYSLKSYYHQGWIKTLFKGFVLLYAYLFCLMIVIFLVLGLSLVIF